MKDALHIRLTDTYQRPRDLTKGQSKCYRRKADDSVCVSDLYPSRSYFLGGLGALPDSHECDATQPLVLKAKFQEDRFAQS